MEIFLQMELNEPFKNTKELHLQQIDPKEFGLKNVRLN